MDFDSVVFIINEIMFQLHLLNTVGSFKFVISCVTSNANLFQRNNCLTINYVILISSEYYMNMLWIQKMTLKYTANTQ